MSTDYKTVSELESAYDSLHTQVQDASQEIRQLEQVCRSHYLTKCVDQIDHLVLGHTIMYRTREREASSCIDDCMAKASPGTKISDFSSIKDRKVIETFEDCRKGCIEYAINKMRGETDMLKRAYLDLKDNYLDKISD